MPVPGWAWWPDGRETVRVLAQMSLWGAATAEVLVPSTGLLVRLPARALRPPEERAWTSAEVAFRAAAGRALGLSGDGAPLALAGGRFEPLPHQTAVLERALTMDPTRLLLADEVGLGKTIEAGLIVRELKARGRVRRIVIVAPKGVQLQWVAEFRNRFGEELVRVGPEGLPVDAGVDPWRAFDQVICSIDAVKPLRQRAGWSPDRVAEHNRRRFRALVDAGWDLVVIDEAHHVAGSSEDVARHRLARELAEAAPNVLLLSATPHSGKSEGFARLLGLLQPELRDAGQLRREIVAPVVIRTEKRSARDQRGVALFQPRQTALEVVPYNDRGVERSLYEAVTEYVRHGYGHAVHEHRPAVGFLVLLMQRLASSSTAAALAALERRMAALVNSGTQLRLLAERSEDWGELSGEEQFAALLEARGAAWTTELAEVESLLELARTAAADGPDAKARFLLDLLRRVQREEGDPALKVLVFTEFVPTQDMLVDLLERAGVPTVAINGTMGLDERALAQAAFQDDAQVLVSTDAGGEGINLQFAHVVVNYDLPWNPMRIEQRIGRVDRIGQQHPVRAFNLVGEHSIDVRVIEILEMKLGVILAELGADKTAEVLTSVGADVTDLYAGAILDPATLDHQADEFVAAVRRGFADSAELRELLRASAPEPSSTQGAQVMAALGQAQAAFENWRSQPVADPVRLLEHLPQVSPAEPVPVVQGAPPGYWSLWEIRPDGAGSLRGATALFRADDGTMRPDIADRVWDALTSNAELRAGPVPDAATWAMITQLGEDYSYDACKRLAGGGAIDAPWLVLRLLVRVER